MRKVLFVALLSALTIVGIAADVSAVPSTSSLTIRFLGEGGIGISSDTFPHLQVELYRYEDGAVEPRWISSSACWEGVERRRLCADTDGVMEIAEDHDGNSLTAGSYLLWVQASNYEGEWIGFDLFEGERLSDTVALRTKPVSVFPSLVRVSAEGDVEVVVGLVANGFRPVRAEVYVVADGPGLTERWMTRQLGNNGRPRVYSVTRRMAAVHREFLRINPNVPDGLTYCFTVYVMRPGSLAFGEAIGRASFCQPKGATAGGGRG